MPVVLDTSVAAAWAMSETNHPLIEFSLLHFRKDSAIVPALFWFEMRNTLVVNERRGRMTVEGSTVFLESLSIVTISVDAMPSEADVMFLARKHGLTVYDAAYLELASRKDFPLATLDRRLEAAARSENVALLSA